MSHIIDLPHIIDLTDQRPIRLTTSFGLHDPVAAAGEQIRGLEVLKPDLRNPLGEREEEQAERRQLEEIVKLKDWRVDESQTVHQTDDHESNFEMDDSTERMNDHSSPGPAAGYFPEPPPFPPLYIPRKAPQIPFVSALWSPVMWPIPSLMSGYGSNSSTGTHDASIFEPSSNMYGGYSYRSSPPLANNTPNITLPGAHSDKTDDEHSPNSEVFDPPNWPSSSTPTMVTSSAKDPFPRDSSLCLDGQIEGRSEYAAATGGYADVWTGLLGDKKVAIKSMRAFNSMGEPLTKAKLLKRVWREYLVWHTLDHPNILKFLGFSYTSPPVMHNDIPSLISPWMDNGDVMSYIRKNPNVDRLNLLIGIASGLLYLHSSKYPPIVHGDLRGGNIMVSDTGVPALTDFGLSRIIKGVAGMTTTSEIAGSLRWMAPELLGAQTRHTQESDVWAFGMTVLELLSGKRPYHDLTNEPMLVLEIYQGGTPTLPEDNVYGESLWSLYRRCWAHDPHRRPPIDEVLLHLRYTQNIHKTYSSLRSS